MKYIIRTNSNNPKYYGLFDNEGQAQEWGRNLYHTFAILPITIINER
jgi:hypothetical protein